MRSFCMGIAGALLAFTLTGCGETVDEGPREFKGTKDPSIDALRDNMSKTVKAGNHTKKPVAETTKPAAETGKPADVKAADSKTTEKKD
jgi:hypothetical protein